jgi:tRNA dimethylallyltransferase
MTPLIAVVGPTASGKTGLAVRIAQQWGAEIVGVDASQVYRGMDIGTGKATADELLGVPHHLLDVAHPHDAFDAQRFVTLADAAIAEIRARGQRVVLCGGTGLYLRALLEGLSEIPPVAPEVTRALRARIDAGEVEALHAERSPSPAQRGVHSPSGTQWVPPRGLDIRRSSSAWLGSARRSTRGSRRECDRCSRAASSTRYEVS